ncbi:MAG: hypothetical protein EHM91_03735 [Planctomycetota bacterium]|nr:MAG: hypothetical protein EHM91_03735 [Planctomycetota bacterium]
MKTVLEVLCVLEDLDFDVRYGVVFLSTPMRLWSTDPAVGLAAPNQWETQILAGEDATIGPKLRSIRVTLDMQDVPLGSMLGYINEISGIKFTADATLSDRRISMKASDLPLALMLKLLSLQNGGDVRIAAGAVHIVPRRQ